MRDILKDSVEDLAFCNTDAWQTTSMNTIIYMEKYRMSKVRIYLGNFEASSQNLIHVEKLI